MNASLTLNTLTFDQSKSGDAGSERREVSRGVNLPEILIIRHQDYVDSGTKVPGVRSNVRIERYVAMADGRIVPVTLSLSVAVPSDSNIVSADVTAVTDRLVNLIHGTTNTSGLGLSASIFVSKQQ